MKTAATYSPTNYGSTIGAVGLNFSVRNGKRWNPGTIATLIRYDMSWPSITQLTAPCGAFCKLSHCIQKTARCGKYKPCGIQGPTASAKRPAGRNPQKESLGQLVALG